MVMQSPMEEGLEAGFAWLEELLSANAQAS